MWTVYRGLYWEGTAILVWGVYKAYGVSILEAVIMILGYRVYSISVLGTVIMVLGAWHISRAACDLARHGTSLPMAERWRQHLPAFQP